MLKGDDLQINASLTFIDNVSEGEEQKGLSFSWECSENLQTVCSENKGRQMFTVFYYEFEASIVEDQQEYVTLVVSRDELVGERQYRETIELQWSRQETPRFTIEKPSRIFSSKENVFGITIENFDIELDPLEITWVIFPEVAAKRMEYSA